MLTRMASQLRIIKLIKKEVATKRLKVFQILHSRNVKVKISNKKDKLGLPKVKIKRGWYYLLGWIIIFIIGILVELFYGAEMDKTELSEKLIIEILRDISSIVMFTNKSS